MEDTTLCGKRRKGLKDLDVGASATHTALMDQLSTLDAIAATTNDPQVYCSLVRQVESIRQRVLALVILHQQQQPKSSESNF
jgi:hypothetical protein